MSGFEVPFSSSPLPSTPDRRTKNGAGLSSFGASNPSTTPAGPPPSSAGSFTPAGPPPSSVLGSSIAQGRYNDQPLSSLRFFNENAPRPSHKLFDSSTSTQSTAPRNGVRNESRRSRKSNEYSAIGAKQRPGGFSADFYDEEHEENSLYDDNHRPNEEDHSDEAEGNIDHDAMAEDDYYDNVQDMEDHRTKNPDPMLKPSFIGHNSSHRSDLLSQSRKDDLIDFQRSKGNSIPGPPQEFSFRHIAKEMYTQTGIPPVGESDEIIIRTEELIIALHEEGITATEDEDALRETLAIIPAQLVKLWTDYAIATTAHVSEEYVAAIGPGPGASNFAKANFLASLLLRLHHPGPVESPTNADSRRLSMQQSSILSQTETTAKQIPVLLLEWMDEYHDPYPTQLQEIQRHKPSPANHRLFWDTVLNSLLRGRVVAVVNALKTAGWRHARNSTDDVREKNGQVGFTGLALSNIEKVINDAMIILQQCPAMRGDWNVKGSEWTLFRLRVDQALENLKQFAEGRNRDVGMGASHFNASPQSYTGIAKKAESQVPWHIYQNLLTMYNLILGDANAVVENSQDWCEATVGLVVWWNPGKDEKRSTLRKSRASVEDTGSETYSQKLAESFQRAIEDSTEFQVNTLDPVEVGLASLLCGDVESVIGLLRSWSGPISSAVAEIAALGGWLPHVEPPISPAIDGFDQADMEVLRLDPPENQAEDIKDQTLIAYASALIVRGELETTARFGHPKTVREGWEIAIEVLGRLNSTERSEQEVGQLIDDFDFGSSAAVGKLWRLLNDLGMTSHAESIAEDYADSLGQSSYMYGEALWYYALAHRPKKAKDVLDLLISFSLINSMAYPPEAHMDAHLQRLIKSPKNTLTEMSKLDYDAAQLLQKILSGYATLRKYYDLREKEIKLPTAEKPKKSAHARKLEAVSALLAVITSADDNIRGGLYDEARGAVVNVDFLLALLGEAMVFVNQSRLILTVSHINTLLKAIEDLQTVSRSIYDPCNEFFQATVASTQGLKGSSPMDLLRKSTSSMSGTSSFSLAGSSMVASQLKRSMSNSGVMVQGNIKRGWDWRRGLTANTTSEDILRILRFGLANDLAKAWVLEADGQL